jgi:hypothetical protein
MQPYLGPTRLRKTRTVRPVDLLTFERRDPSDLTLFRALYGPRERVLLGAILRSKLKEALSGTTGHGG